MRKRDYLLSGCLFAMGLGISSGAMACATGQWDVTFGTAVAGNPTPFGATSRVEQICGLAVSGGQGYVQDNSPLDTEDSRIRLRFYVLASAPGGATTDVVILRAFQDDGGASPAFTISYKPAGANQISFNPTGGSASAVNAPFGWLLVEIDWKAGEYFRYWVNASPNVAEDNFTGATDAGSASKIGMVRLGAPDTMGELTKLTFDSYQANRSNPVRGLLIADANADGFVDSTDASAALIETELGITIDQLAKGQPDCNMDGSVDSTDVSCVLILTEL